MYRYVAGQAVDSQALDRAHDQVNAMETRLRAIEPRTRMRIGSPMGGDPGTISFADVVSDLQQTGQFGVDVVAPAIDAAGAAATQPFTHAAWDLNGRLHSEINTWQPLGAGLTDMQHARELAWQMLAQYAKAIVAGRQSALQAAQSRAPGPTARPAVSAAVQGAAQALLGAIHATVAAGQPVMWSAARGQGSAMWRPTWNFQKAVGRLKVDGVYGAQTEAALKATVGPGAVAGAYTHGAAAAGYWPVY